MLAGTIQAYPQGKTPHSTQLNNVSPLSPLPLMVMDAPVLCSETSTFIFSHMYVPAMPSKMIHFLKTKNIYFKRK
jgi:hypothetical protein